MTVADIKTAWKANQNVIYDGAEYEIYSIAYYKDKDANTFCTGIILKDVNANSIIQVSAEKIEGVKE
jgi:hypothetical protein